MARVQVVKSLKPEDGYGQQWRLILQWCRYLYDDGSTEHGYRFIWVSPEGKLQPARGQARLRSLKITQELMAKAKAQGWGNYDAEVIDASRGRLLLRTLDFSPPIPASL